MLIIFVICVALIIIVAVTVSKITNDATKAANKAALEAVDDFYPEVGFIGGKGLSAIGFDMAGRRLAISHAGHLKCVLGFSQIVSAEVAMDGHSVASVNRGSQLVGAAIGSALLGPAGFLVGGMSGSSTSTQKLKRLALKIYTTDMLTPVVEAVFLNLDVLIPVGSDGFKQAYQPLDENLGRIKAILHAAGNKP